MSKTMVTSDSSFFPFFIVSRSSNHPLTADGTSDYYIFPFLLVVSGYLNFSTLVGFSLQSTFLHLLILYFLHLSHLHILHLLQIHFSIALAWAIQLLYIKWIIKKRGLYKYDDNIFLVFLTNAFVELCIACITITRFVILILLSYTIILIRIFIK